MRVSSIINRTSQDPHSYEATTQDKLAVSKAELVVENGGGYDDFIHKLADDTGLDQRQRPERRGGLRAGSGRGCRRVRARAADADGHGHEHAGFNEHVWYSLPAMARLADAVAAKLGELEPSSAETFRSNAAAFKESLGGLETKLAGIKASAGAAPVAVTEPVPLYLLEAAGLDNQTPAEYTAAIEEDTDVPPAVLKATTDLMELGQHQAAGLQPADRRPADGRRQGRGSCRRRPGGELQRDPAGGQVLPAVDDRECRQHRQGTGLRLAGQRELTAQRD